LLTWLPYQLNYIEPIDLVPDKEQVNLHHVHLPLILNKDVEFKFMVDGEWRYADDLPHLKDKSNVFFIYIYIYIYIYITNFIYFRWKYKQCNLYGIYWCQIASR
jgi:hypothetical protein